MLLRESLVQIPSCVKNSNNVAIMLIFLNELDDVMFLFTVDATAMHPSINTEKGLTFLTLSLDNLMFKSETNWPRSDIINAMKLLLRFNVFQFGDDCNRQKNEE